MVNPLEESGFLGYSRPCELGFLGFSHALALGGGPGFWGFSGLVSLVILGFVMLYPFGWVWVLGSLRPESLIFLGFGDGLPLGHGRSLGSK